MEPLFREYLDEGENGAKQAVRITGVAFGERTDRGWLEAQLFRKFACMPLAELE